VTKYCFNVHVINGNADLSDTLRRSHEQVKPKPSMSNYPFKHCAAESDLYPIVDITSNIKYPPMV